MKEGRDLGREEVGRRVGEVLGAGPIDKNTVAAWFTRVLPPADVGVGLAVVYGVRAGWLYFGEGDTNDSALGVAVKPERETPPKVLQHSSKKRRKG